jgi:hypothetical protein
MDTSKIIRKLVLSRMNNLACAITNQVDCPNYGGCAVIAAHVGMYLEQAGLLKDIVTQYNKGGEYGKSPKYVREVLKAENARTDDCSNWDMNGLSRSHLAVRFEFCGLLYTWDSDGTRQGGNRFGDKREYRAPPVGEGLFVDECIALANDEAQWNSRFNREQIPKIEKIIREHLSSLKQEIEYIELHRFQRRLFK